MGTNREADGIAGDRTAVKTGGKTAVKTAGRTRDDTRYELSARPVLQSHPQFASTLANGLDVLRCFTVSRSSLGNKELAELLGFTRPTVSRLTFTLVGLGYLQRDAKTQKYSLGPAVLSLGYPLLASLTVRQLAAHDMVELARFARGPISLGLRDRLSVVYVETIYDQETNLTRPDIGSSRPLLRTAIGRALLYAHDKLERELIFARLAEEFPDDWARYEGGVRDAFEQIRRRGFCIVAGDWNPALCAVGVPMKYRVNGAPMAFNLTVPAYATDEKYLAEVLGPRLCELVRNVDYRLGMP
ncbi:IclR family transcriptional regulator [Lacisediminimonas profundi]|uniref:IclR family transcriptional regulator n=1 Tax=Lacisediminimonas profundi TaxID=2603856 RepID=UPI00124BADD8|nr:IclR family transcriptional regulator [Lacisediminimonas profundi]